MGKQQQTPIELGFLQFDESVKRALQTVSAQLKDFQGIPDPNQKQQRRQGQPQGFNPFGVF